MSGTIDFRRKSGKTNRTKPIRKPSAKSPTDKPRTPPRPNKLPSIDAEPKTCLGPEDFPRTLTLDLPPAERNSDIAKLLCEMKLPLCVKLTESYAVPGCSTALNEGDLFLLHFIYDNPTVHATTSKGKKMRLPIYAKQKYELLPLDPRLDDKSYIGTKALMDADPLPAAVRVVEAHCSIRKDEDQEADEILEIHGFEEDEERGRLLVGMSGSSPFKYSTDLTTSRYTTMLCPDFLYMPEIIERKFPQRLRIPDEKKDFGERKFKEEKVLHLEKFTYDKCVVATRATDNHIYTIPVTEPINIKHMPMAIKDRHILDILPSLYPLVNTTWGLVDPTQETLSTPMAAIPQPIHAVVDAWLASEEGKKRACDVANRRVENLKEEIASAYTEMRNLKTSLDFYKNKTNFPSDQPPPPRPPRTPPHTSTNQRKGLQEESPKDPPKLPPRPPNSRNNSDVSSADEYYQIVEEATSPIPVDSTRNVNVMNEVREVLAKKERELKEKTKELDKIRKQYEILKEEHERLKKNVPVYQDIPDIPGPRTSRPANSTCSNEDYLEPIVTSLPPRSRSLRKYTVAEVGEFLRKHDLVKYIDIFRNNGVDGKILVSLDEDHMRSLDMTRLHALKLKIEVENMQLPPVPDS